MVVRANEHIFLALFEKVCVCVCMLETCAGARYKR